MPVKILIADDEPNQLELLSYNLVQAGFDVAQAHDGQAAMTMIEDWHPDLVVLDWMMPHISGVELAGYCGHAPIRNCCQSSFSAPAVKKATARLGWIRGLMIICRNPFHRASWYRGSRRFCGDPVQP